MAKPDLQAVYVSTADGELKKMKGKLGLDEAFKNLVGAANDAAAAASGVPLRGTYYDTATGAVHVRLT